jgi:hypothetical protein
MILFIEGFDTQRLLMALKEVGKELNVSRGKESLR